MAIPWGKVNGRNRPQSASQLYATSVYRFSSVRYTRAAIASQRLRSILMLIAVEERAQELGIGALPPVLMTQLRLFGDYKNATAPSHYRPRKGRRPKAGTMYSSVPSYSLETECGHPATDPVLAKLVEGDRLLDIGQANEGVFCNRECAQERGRRVVALIEDMTGPGY